MVARKSLTIREVPQLAAGALSPFLADIKRAIDAINAAAVSSDDLVAAGIASRGGDGGLLPYTPSEESPDIAPPPPTALKVTSGVGTIFLEFGGIFFPGFAYVEVLRHTADVFSAAEVVGTTAYTMYVDPVGIDSPTYYYWVRAVSRAGTVGMPNSQVGTSASTKLVDTPQIADFAVSNAKIANLAVDDAKIASLAVDKLLAGSLGVGQHIQSLNYVAGDTGWRINANGTAEFSGVVVRGTIIASQGQIGGSTIGANYVRSTNYVLNTSGWNLNSDGTGQIGGFTIASDHIKSSNYVAGSAGWKITQGGVVEVYSLISRGALMNGPFTSFTGWPEIGNGFYLGPEGLKIGSAIEGMAATKIRTGSRYRIASVGGTDFTTVGATSNAVGVEFTASADGTSLTGTGTVDRISYFAVTAAGDIYGYKWNVINGVMNITQANIIDTLQIKGNAVTVPAGASLASNTLLTTAATPATVLSTSLNTEGNPAWVMVEVYAYSTAGSSVMTLEVWVGGVLRRTEQYDIVVDGTPWWDGGSFKPTSRMLSIYVPSPGTGVVSVEVRARAGLTTYLGMRSNLFAIGTKR